MNANLRFLIILALGAAASGYCSAQETLHMQKPLALPRSGLELKLPILFQPGDPSSPFEELSATRSSGTDVDQTISLNVLPVNENITAEKYSQKMLADIKADLAVRHLKVLSETQTQVASLKACARSMEYTYRGLPTSSISICFVRSMKAYEPANPSCCKNLVYILTMEVSQKQKKQLLNTVDAIVKSIKLTDPINPALLGVNLKRRPFIKNFKRGMAMRVPENWWSELTQTGVTMGQYNYLVGKNSPVLQIHSVTVPKDISAKDCGLKALEIERKKGAQFNILSQGPAKLAGKDGYQFVLQETLQLGSDDKATSKPTIKIIQARRLLCVPAKDKAHSQRHYAFILTCINTDSIIVKKLIDQLAESFDTLPVVKDEDIIKKTDPLEQRKEL